MDGYDGFQVCVNGHAINDYATSQPQHSQKRCSECGARTILACEACNHPMRGEYHVEGVYGGSLGATIPKYCIECGEAFPWQQASIENLKDVLQASNVSKADMDLVVLALPDVLHDTPRTEGAALKVLSVLSRLRKPTYDIAVKVISDIASTTAKTALGI